MVLLRLSCRKLGAGAHGGQSANQPLRGRYRVARSRSLGGSRGLGWGFCSRGSRQDRRGGRFLPLSECVPPPTMRAAALSHLRVGAGCICRAAGGCRWADDSAKLRSLSAAGSASALGAVRPVAAPARIRAQLLPPLPLPHERSNPHATEGAGAGASYNGSVSTAIYHLSTILPADGFLFLGRTLDFV